MSGDATFTGQKSWPADGLERVGSCAVCGGGERELLHAGLTDRIFFVAHGEWTMWRCSSCRSGYLDPRPTKETIGLAYEDYFTHDSAPQEAATGSRPRLRTRLGNGYRNWRFGTRMLPALSAGRYVAALARPLRWAIDAEFRYLPLRTGSQRNRVLDIGCGNGSWLRMIRDWGADVAGVEPDPKAAAIARAQGIDVRPNTSDWIASDVRFDHVTLSHVIEHVHDPLQLLNSCHELLKPGGSLFVDTPNIDAEGHRLYGRNWVGLDAPRHLAVFTPDSLVKAVEGAGFKRVMLQPHPGAFPVMSLQSRRVAAGLNPYANSHGSELQRPPRLWNRIRAVAGKRSEFLTLTAAKL